MHLKVNGQHCSIHYIIIVIIMDLKYVENSEWPWIWRSTVVNATNINWFLLIPVLENVRKNTKTNSVAWIRPEIEVAYERELKYFEHRTYDLENNFTDSHCKRQTALVQPVRKINLFCFSMKWWIILIAISRISWQFKNYNMICKTLLSPSHKKSKPESPYFTSTSLPLSLPE